MTTLAHTRSTGIGFSSYTLSSSISIIPWSVVFVYFGSLVTTLADVLDGKAGPDPAYRSAFFVGSGLLLAVVMAWTTIISRRDCSSHCCSDCAQGQPRLSIWDEFASLHYSKHLLQFSLCCKRVLGTI